MSTLIPTPLPPLAVTLTDASPDPEQSGDWWHLAELTADPHEDYITTGELPQMLAIYCRAGVPFSVCRLPGATAEMQLEAARDQMDSSLRWHPSLSAAERNA